MKNFIYPGETVQWTNPSTAVASGAVIVFPVGVGVAAVDIANGATGSVDVEGVFELVKETGVAFAQGDALYWDLTNFRLTKTSAGNRLIGVAAEPALSAAALGRVKLTQWG